MRLAMAISPSRDSSSTEPISRRYMRTGSSVRSAGSACSALRRRRREARLDQVAALLLVLRGLGSALGRRSPSASSASTTLMPISVSIARMSSICSEVTSSDGSTSFSSS